MRTSAQLTQQTAKPSKAQCIHCGSVDGLMIAGPKEKSILICSFCAEESRPNLFIISEDVAIRRAEDTCK